MRTQLSTDLSSTFGEIDEIIDFSAQGINEFSELENDLSGHDVKIIKLKHNNIQCFDPNFFKKHNQIKFLDISENNISDLNGIGMLSDLVLLDCSKNLLTSISNIENCQKLKRLLLSSNDIASVSLKQPHQKLLFLDLHNNPMKSLTFCKFFPNLTELYMDRCELTKLDGLELLKSLKHFTVSNNKISKGNPVICDTLVDIDISNNILKDLSLFSKLSNLGFLTISGNPIDDSSFDKLPVMEKLRGLKCARTKVSKIHKLAKIFPNLEYVDMEFTQISDEEEVIDFLQDERKLLFFNSRKTPLFIEMTKDMKKEHQIEKSSSDKKSNSGPNDKLKIWDSLSQYSEEFGFSTDFENYRQRILSVTNDLKILDCIKVTDSELFEFEEEESSDIKVINESASDEYEDSENGENSPTNYTSLFLKADAHATDTDLESSGRKSAAFSSLQTADDEKTSARQSTAKNETIILTISEPFSKECETRINEPILFVGDVTHSFEIKEKSVKLKTQKQKSVSINPEKRKLKLSNSYVNEKEEPKNKEKINLLISSSFSKETPQPPFKRIILSETRAEKIFDNEPKKKQKLSSEKATIFTFSPKQIKKNLSNNELIFQQKSIPKDQKQEERIQILQRDKQKIFDQKPKEKTVFELQTHEKVFEQKPKENNSLNLQNTQKIFETEPQKEEKEENQSFTQENSEIFAQSPREYNFSKENQENLFETEPIIQREKNMEHINGEIVYSQMPKELILKQRFRMKNNEIFSSFTKKPKIKVDKRNISSYEKEAQKEGKKSYEKVSGFTIKMKENPLKEEKTELQKPEIKISQIDEEKRDELIQKLMEQNQKMQNKINELSSTISEDYKKQIDHYTKKILKLKRLQEEHLLEIGALRERTKNQSDEIKRLKSDNLSSQKSISQYSLSERDQQSFQLMQKMFTTLESHNRYLVKQITDLRPKIIQKPSQENASISAVISAILKQNTMLHKEIIRASQKSDSDSDYSSSFYSYISEENKTNPYRSKGRISTKEIVSQWQQKETDTEAFLSTASSYQSRSKSRHHKNHHSRKQTPEKRQKDETIVFGLSPHAPVWTPDHYQKKSFSNEPTYSKHH